MVELGNASMMTRKMVIERTIKHEVVGKSKGISIMYRVDDILEIVCSI